VASVVRFVSWRLGAFAATGQQLLLEVKLFRDADPPDGVQ
jgi:hypothetical protein